MQQQCTLDISMSHNLISVRNVHSTYGNLCSFKVSCRRASSQMRGAFAGKECSGQCLWQVSRISDHNNYFRFCPTKDLSHGYLSVLNANQKSVFRKILPLIRYEDYALPLCAYVVWHDLPVTRVQLLPSFEIKEIHIFKVHTGFHLSWASMAQRVGGADFFWKAIIIYIYTYCSL